MKMHMLIRRFAGCASGACPLTRHPVISSIYGAVLGALLATSIL